MKNYFKTSQLSVFQYMIKAAIKDGLVFEAYTDNQGFFIIEYTGGY